ncbi:Single-stranded-DNA-specific exonuclease RecJ [Fervidicola ferrireducens]|uniref:Single-stranded-DNA-specific exonuclease RecJ n=1 Tax=Fervidicola ferrireducens TaxID=520764 RepID=A0A140LCD5_9FIRM|nr:single-stranded-DNA-specific exonuclease RecJ [Fervidicola ferrireducens]KXG78210.1 Single-stranded-DNA-specific exonuclease RecJ [Fervidicola ferrireducens]
MIDGNYLWELCPPVIPSYNVKNLHPVILKLLKSRGIEKKEDVVRFLRVSVDDMYNPFLLKDMEKAVTRVKKAILNGEKITVYGDYDVDGVTGCALLVRALREMGGNVDFYIPSRLEEGYGLNKEAVEKIAKSGTKLIITVDNGIASQEEVIYAKELGMDTVITDHHEPHDDVPKAIAVINPKQKDCSYPFKELAGVGVALKLIQALSNCSREVTVKLLDLVALGTIADMVPLVDENRIIAKCGINVLRSTDKKGLLALLEECRLSVKNIDEEKISYILAPRLNAAGRLLDAALAVQLLLADEEKEAQKLAKDLEVLNRERQAVETKIYNEAKEYILKNVNFDKEKVIVASGSGWHPGVIGIVASKLVQNFCIPCILISEEGEEGRGSARSIPGFNIFEALKQLSGMLDKFGGHEQAAGFTIKVNEIENFRSKINELAKSIAKDSWEMKLKIDMELTPEELTTELAEQLELLKPFGFGNPKPVFVCRNMSIEQIKTVGEKENHLKIRLKKREKEFSAIGFNFGNYKNQLEIAPLIDVAFWLELNEWEGNKKLQLNLKDIKIPFLRDEIMIKLEEEYYNRFLNVIREMDFNNVEENRYSIGNEIKFIKVKNKRKYVKSLFESDKRTLVKVNTPYQAWRLLAYLKKFDIVKSDVGVFFNLDSKDILSKKNVILIDPRADSHKALSDVMEEIVFYDPPFSVELMKDHILDLPSHKLHLIFNREDLRYNYLVCEKLLPGKQILALTLGFVYSLSKNKKNTFSLNELVDYLRSRNLKKADRIIVINVLNVLEELGILKYVIDKDEAKVLHFNFNLKRLDISLSPTYQKLLLLRKKVIEFYNNFQNIQELLKQEEI